MSNRTPLRFLTYAIVTGSLLFSAAHLVGCTTTGQLAGKSGPVSAAATVQAACAAVPCQLEQRREFLDDRDRLRGD